MRQTILRPGRDGIENLRESFAALARRLTLRDDHQRAEQRTHAAGAVEPGSFQMFCFASKPNKYRGRW